MTAFMPETSGHHDQRLDGLLQSLPAEDVGSMRFILLGGELLLEGWVTSYETKCRIEKTAQAAGFRIQNCLRVVPGVPLPSAAPSSFEAPPSGAPSTV